MAVGSSWPGRSTTETTSLVARVVSGPYAAMVARGYRPRTADRDREKRFMGPDRSSKAFLRGRQLRLRERHIVQREPARRLDQPVRVAPKPLPPARIIGQVLTLVRTPTTTA